MDKIDFIKTDLPGKIVISKTWLMFNLITTWEDQQKTLQFVKSKLAEWRGDKRCIFIDEEPEQEDMETDHKVWSAAIFTIFVSVKGIPSDRIFKLDKDLQDVFANL